LLDVCLCLLGNKLWNGKQGQQPFSHVNKEKRVQVAP